MNFLFTGPGTYHLENVKLDHAPAYTMSGKGKSDKIEQTPGNYHLENKSGLTAYKDKEDATINFAIIDGFRTMYQNTNWNYS